MQITLSGKTLDQVAIDRIREFEPLEGYELAFSGGKDSVVIYDLAKRAGVKFKSIYRWTTVDPPELLQFIKDNYPDCEIRRPEKTMWQLIESKGMLPLRNRRYCCEYLKEADHYGQTIITGVRWQESFRRRQRRMYEICSKDGISHFLHPIIDWTEKDIWNYIREKHITYCSLYDEGFKRIGCILCPMTTFQQTMRDMKRWPKVAQAWRHACHRIYKANDKVFPGADELFDWWLSRKGIKKEDSQCLMFHD